jgi:hypothetical protein
LATVTALILAAVQSSNAQGPSSEDTKTRPNKQEIIDVMMKVGRMPAQQQNGKIDSIWQDISASKAPRSDFLFCLGLAYSGNYRAQKCAGSAYEKGVGIVEDLSEAYIWYAIALENRITDQSLEEMIQAEKERLKASLLSTYPHPSEDDLDDMVRAQKTRIAQYQEDVKRVKK